MAYCDTFTIPQLCHNIHVQTSKNVNVPLLLLQVIASEAVTWLYFVDSYARKNDFGTLGPCLYVGTDLGSLIAIVVSLPERTGENRLTEPVIVSPSGSLFR